MESLWKYKTHIEIKNKEHVWDFIRRYLKESDLVIAIYGRKGSGKSWTALSISERIDHTFNKEKVSFTLEAFFKEMSKEDNKSHAHLLDDFGSELDPNEFNDVCAKLASHFFQKSRTFHNVYIITTPNRAFLNKTMRDRLCDIYCEVVSKNKKKGYTKIKFSLIQANQKTGKVYFHNLKVDKSGRLDFGTSGKKITFHLIPKPSRSVRSWYLKARAQIGDSQLKSTATGILEYKDKIKYVFDQITSKNDELKYRKVYHKRISYDFEAIAEEYNLSDNQARKIARKLKKLEEQE